MNKIIKEINISKDLCIHLTNEDVREALEEILMDGIQNLLKKPILDHIKEKQDEQEDYWIDGKDKELTIDFKITFVHDNPTLGEK